MTMPSPKLLRQWLPMIGGGAFTLWTVFLVVLSLLPAGNEALPGPEGTKQMPIAPSACVTMPDSLLICDQISFPADNNP